ncbi:hypothetical protein [Chryseosolibacter indicus]|uniref:Uncharacterized protein n=1 Tax=Chryseosolibacter indicus TaxID=2782351 RepID=A0ABS5VR40_9BACT|nr:hypothetical protein [Chryseosolibacter indicus]MBT1703907.1 hypothetical protein [Chryseosolibacter indicus]
MKRILYITALLLVLVVGVNAQEVKTSSEEGTKESVVKKKTRKQDHASLLAGAIPVELLDIPDGLRMTLQENKIYRGWENASIFFVENAKQYLLQLMKSNKSKIYLFDETGKPIMAKATRKNSSSENNSNMQKTAGR